MDQTTESFLRTEAIFNEALAAPLETREALIAARSQGDRELEAEVRSLLEACAEEERLTAARRWEPEAGREAAAASRRIGPYELDRLLGRGGMGAVYLAHRADGNFEQKVAIKLIDLPLATDIFRERFRQERQILAGLQHPYIARLLDGGVTSGGDLYLAMEYVDGVPIHRYCEEKRLTQPERLALFLRVCEAVEFAHQNFVVHRDLKPDNILVAADGTPRLLDFGTAKLLSPTSGNAGSQLTREGYQSFTPQYASPEQVLGNPITAATDTYSLGVLLYLLLTGILPYELKELSTGEMLRAICEEPPRRPAGAEGKRLDADLEAILLKALRKEPRERYLTAEQFAADVRAWLDGRPVGARRGTLRYRASKFIRRNRLALAGAALLAITLLAGIAGVLWQARVANRERRKAEARSADLRQLSNSLLSELDEAIKELPGSTGAQKLLVTRVLEHLDRMAKDAQGDRQTQLDLIDAYTRLGQIQGDPYNQNMGDPAGALSSIDKAIALAAPLVPDGSRDREALQALAAAQETRAEILFGTPRMQEAILYSHAAIATYNRLIALPQATSYQICATASAYGELGDNLGKSGTASLYDFAGALAAYRTSLDLYRRALSIDPGLTAGKRAYAIGQVKIGDIEVETDPAQAFQDYELALQRVKALPKSEQGNLRTMRLHSLLLVRKAFALVQLGAYSEAHALFAEAEAQLKPLAEADTKDLRALGDYQLALNEEASGFEDAADPALAVAGSDRRQSLIAAEKLLTQVVAMLNRAVRLVQSNEEWVESLADAQIRLGTAQSTLHPSAKPTEAAQDGMAAMRKLTGEDQHSPEILNDAAKAFLKVEPVSLRDPSFAVSCAERAVALTHRRVPSMLLTLAQAYRATGQAEKSRATATEGLALLPAPQPGSAKPRLRKLLEIQAQAAR
jgi:hypothetical protein